MPSYPVLSVRRGGGGGWLEAIAGFGLAAEVLLRVWLKIDGTRVLIFDYRQIDLNQKGVLFGVHDSPLGLSPFEGSEKVEPWMAQV